ncbi:ImmA/IrrE family metallo-endopeptidase [Cupriavidus sp. CV2]|uniref:ImmA/IrrE family metallo-endopeptidase n=1 Tax=Cupriavidus ulmosensis TaxID=3065913 RepID=UPI00296AFE9A|nr:ImmA/IrrE family metallo-endopeptidase [Cupriavidus sp. CV2]MDW3682635.1 ImmA/IrrE family metallo-endopeptidase [Cupriavidus sp. CV2]
MEPLSESEIIERAKRFCAYMGIRKKTAQDFAQFLEGLTQVNICLDPVEDREWLSVTDATCDPTSFRIMLPNRTYVAACRGDHAAMATIFHELGHLVLGHKAVLHKENSAPPTREEDAEWQADGFAAYIVRYMGLAPYGQMSFDFGSE